MDVIVSLCKRRGFIFPGSEIYDGLAGTYDYGPLGVELKNNVKRAWWKAMVQQRDDMEGVDAAILMNPRTWEASGHVSNFNDPMCDCKLSQKRYRADHLEPVEGLQKWALIETAGEGEEPTQFILPNPILARSKKEAKQFLQRLQEDVETFKNRRLSVSAPSESEEPFTGLRSPDYGGPLTEPRMFNLMLKTHCGPAEDSSTRVYLRPETAQGIFTNFLNVLNTSRRKLPFGIAQMGKSFRNEITPRNFIFRVREFEQMEIEFFCKPEEYCQPGERNDMEWWEYWLEARMNWYLDLGIRKENLKFRQHDDDELAHYAKACSDVNYLFPHGWDELEGIAHRSDFDLKQHQEFSGKDQSYFDPMLEKRYLPFVIEPSAGVDRGTLAFLIDAYREDEVKGQKRAYLSMHPALAPIKAAVLPLLKNRPEIVEKARALCGELKRFCNARYDDTAAIGKLYRRQDEIGTPFCITVDVESLEDGQATIRERDTMEQQRMPLENIPAYIREQLAAADAL
ncbi:glycine--tRNA ligase [Candidatus Sumerlaeota bacterium]|nr:glycine--tRNA ligase [Candidatus Sumerlaeota bacterium]